MSKFILPRWRTGDDTHVMKAVSSSTIRCINPSLLDQLTSLKTRIDMCQSEWDSAKRLTNPCEFIHTPPPQARFAIARKTPASRAYFKMVELLQHVDAVNAGLNLLPLVSFHLAEGPGGFIEALIDHRPTMPDKHYGITLLTDEQGVPGWRKGRRFLSAQGDRVTLLEGVDGTGNIMNMDTFGDILDKYGGTCDIVTADGGIDFSANYSDQESTALPLIIAETCYALGLQRAGGTFLLKVFDTLMSTTEGLLYSLSKLYTQVAVHKPNTSRAGNSERYIVCTGFAPRDRVHLLDNVTQTLAMVCGGALVTGIGSIPPPLFTAALSEINCVIGQRQLENISATFDIICNHKKPQEERLIEHNIALCIKWCQEHRVPFAQRERTNIFLGKSRTPDQSVNNFSSMGK